MLPRLEGGSLGHWPRTEAWLFGGDGRDLLFAGRGDDILIGGTTDYDANDAALAAILAEWNSLGENYSMRIASLQNPSFAHSLNASTVHDDGSSDYLLGGSGSMGISRI